MKIFISYIVILSLNIGCALNQSRREKDRDAFIDCVKLMFNTGLSEDGARGACKDAIK